MANSAEGEDLQRYLDDKAISMIPAMVVLLVFMVVGLPGNLMVFFYYGFKTKHTTNTMFICAMATYDVVCFSVALPMHMYDLRYLYEFSSSSLCKCMLFITRFKTLGSAATLFVIALDRYRRICQPFKKQFTIPKAKVACGVVLGFSLLLSWPAIVLYDVESISLNGTKVTGTSDCSSRRTPSYKAFIEAYLVLLLIIFLLTIMVLSFTYTLIGKVIMKNKRARQSYSTPKPSASNSNDFDLAHASKEEDKSDLANTKNSSNPSDDIVTERTQNELENKTERPITDIKKSHDNTQHRQHVKNFKYTILMLVISVLFIVSFLPYCILLIWRASINGHEEENLTKSEIAVFNFFIRSYFINSAINPVTYGIFNTRFRHFFLKTFCCCWQKLPGVITASSELSSGHS